MSSMLSRVSTILKAKMNEALDAAENPNELLDLSYEQQIEQLQTIRRGIADVVTAKVRLQLQLVHLREDSARFDTQARQALAANRDDLARLALSRKAEVAQRIKSLQAEAETLEGRQAELQAGEQRLAAKIEIFRTTKETIKAQYTAAQAQVRIGEAASGLSEEMADVSDAVRRVQDKTQAMQARATAIGELSAAGTLPDFLTVGGDDLQAELDQIAVSGAVDAELTALKTQIAQGTASPAQLAAPPGAGSLIVRVQGGGQYRLASPEVEELRELERRLSGAVETHNAQDVQELLHQMVDLVQTRGGKVVSEELATSEITLPTVVFTVEEAQALLREDGAMGSAEMKQEVRT